MKCPSEVCVLEQGHAEVCAGSFLEARLMKDLAVTVEQRDALGEEAWHAKNALAMATADNDQLRSLLGFTTRERDGLRAVLEQTQENVFALANEILQLRPQPPTTEDKGAAVIVAAAALAFLGARAEVKP